MAKYGLAQQMWSSVSNRRILGRGNSRDTRILLKPAAIPQSDPGTTPLRRERRLGGSRHEGVGVWGLSSNGTENLCKESTIQPQLLRALVGYTLLRQPLRDNSRVSLGLISGLRDDTVRRSKAY